MSEQLQITWDGKLRIATDCIPVCTKCLNVCTPVVEATKDAYATGDSPTLFEIYSGCCGAEVDEGVVS